MTTVLVIENDLDTLALIVEVLRGEYEVIGTDSVNEGLALAREHIPTLVICDVRLQELDGYAVLECLRADPVTRSIPVALLTSSVSTADVRKADALGANGYVPEPFTLAGLRAAVAAWTRS